MCVLDTICSACTYLDSIVCKVLTSVVIEYVRYTSVDHIVYHISYMVFVVYSLYIFFHCVS